MIDKKDMGKLGPEEMRILKNLADPAKLSEEEKREAAEYLSNVIGNVEYNKRVSRVLEERKDLSKIEKGVLIKLRTLSHKTRGFDDMDIDKAESNWTKIKDGVEILSEDRLTLKELGALYDIVSAKSILEGSFSEMMPFSDDLKKVASFGERAFMLTITVSGELGLDSGNIMVTDFSKIVPFKGATLGTESKLTKMITRYSHAMQVFIDPIDKVPMVSHVGKTYTVDPASLEYVSYSDVFKINAIKLLSPEARAALQEKYGEKFEEYVQGIFRKASDRFHMNAGDKLRLLNSQSRRVKAGAADFGLFGGHESWGAKSFSHLFESAPTESTCSEFVANATISTVLDFGKEIEKELPALSGTIVRMPFGPRERISRIHPERLVALLKRAGVLEQVPLSKSLAQFIATEDPERQKRFHKAQAALKKDPIALLLEDKKAVVSQLEALKKVDGVDVEKIDEAIAYIEKLAKEKNWPILSAITNKFKRIFRVATTQDRLRRVLKTCEEIKDITTTSIERVYDTKVGEARKRYLGSKTAPLVPPSKVESTTPELLKAHTQGLMAVKRKSSEAALQEYRRELEALRSRFEAERMMAEEKKGREEALQARDQDLQALRSKFESEKALIEKKEDTARELMAKKAAASKAALQEHAEGLKALSPQFKAAERLAKQREEARRREAENKKAEQSARSRAVQFRAAARGRGVTARTGMRAGPRPRAGKAR